MYPEVLPAANKLLLPQLKKLSRYTLSGGTALALQLGHRMSVDFDFFSSTQIEKKLWSQLKAWFKGCSIIPLVDTADELTVVINDVKFTFLYYPYPALAEPILWSEIKLYSITDIAPMKAQTIGRRSTYKDYFDIYTILKLKQYTLLEIITLAEKKFGDDFNGRIFLEQLLYHEDIVDTNITLIQGSILSNEVFAYLQTAVEGIQL